MTKSYFYFVSKRDRNEQIGWEEAIGNAICFKQDLQCGRESDKAENDIGYQQFPGAQKEVDVTHQGQKEADIGKLWKDVAIVKEEIFTIVVAENLWRSNWIED